MSEDVRFQWIAGILFALMVVVLVRYRGPSERQGEKIPWREEGYFVMIVLRAAGFGMWLSVIAQIVAGRWMRWAQVDLPVFWRWVGVALIAAAVPFTIWTLKTIGKNITQTVGIRDNHELVTEGPYRWIRHPLYTFGSLIFIGFSLILSSWLTGILALIGFVMLMVRLPQEEANLIDHFGQAYIDYKATTGALLPRLR